MLDKAKQKNVYRELFQADLTNPLNIEDKTYDSIICVGTFTCGHVGPEALHELVRITKPKGYICITVREQAREQDPYRETIDKISHKGDWRLITEITTGYIIKEDTTCQICLYQVK